MNHRGIALAPHFFPMSHPPELEVIPTAGSLVGRHLIVREIAKGTIGPLYLARTQNNDSVSEQAVDTLARVIPLPADLPARDDQLIAEAIWDSANVGHDMVLRVADVVAGQGWVTLIHDYCPGSLLGLLHWRAGDVGSCFPSDVAARIALDVLEGLEQSRSLSESNRIPWRPGSISMGSLYLCGDGRTRALDGQVMAAVMRSARMRALANTSIDVAPEMHDETVEPDERTDVFAVGAVLWELLTGSELQVERSKPVADVSQSVPNGIRVPQGLAQGLHRALELDPAKRQSTLRELAVELVMGAEKVATYEQVLEFASTIMPYETAFQPTGIGYGESRMVPATTAPATIDPPAPTVPATTDAPTPTDATTPQSQPQKKAEPSAPRFASPFAPLGPAPTQRIASEPQLQPARVLAPEATIPVEAGAGGAVQPELASKPKEARLEQIDWPEEVAGGPGATKPREPTTTDPAKKSNGAKPLDAARDQLDTLPGPGASVVTGKDSNRQDSSRQDSDGKDSSVVTNPVVASRPDPASIKQPELSTKSARRESVRPSSKPAAAQPSPAKQPSVRPRSSKSVEALLAERDAGLSKKKRGGLQVSMTTLILGFSTTVLAVVVIMFIVMRQPGPINAGTQPQQSHIPAQPAQLGAQAALPIGQQTPTQASAIQSPGPQTSSEQIETPAGKNPNQRASLVGAKTAEPDPRTAADKQKRSGKMGGSTASKGADEDEDSKAPKRSKHYVPNDL